MSNEYPDKIAIPKTRYGLQSGKSIRETGLSDIFLNDGKAELDFAGDKRFYELIGFATAVGEAISQKNLSLLPKLEGKDGDEADAAKRNAFLKAKAQVVIDAKSNQLREKNLAEIMHEQMLFVRGEYDRETTEISALQNELHKDAFLKYGLVAENEFKTLKQAELLERIEKLPTDIRENLFMEIFNIDIKISLRHAGIVTKEEFDSLPDFKDGITLFDYIYSLPEEKKARYEQLKNRETENSADFGKDGSGKAIMGDVCRHMAPCMAAMMDAAGSKAYAMGCQNHVTVISAETGNRIEPTARPQEIYLLSAQPSGTFETILGGEVFTSIRPNGSLSHIFTKLDDYERLKEQLKKTDELEERAKSPKALYNQWLERNLEAPEIPAVEPAVRDIPAPVPNLSPPGEPKAIGATELPRTGLQPAQLIA